MQSEGVLQRADDIDFEVIFAALDTQGHAYLPTQKSRDHQKQQDAEPERESKSLLHGIIVSQFSEQALTDAKTILVGGLQQEQLMNRPNVRHPTWRTTRLPRSRRLAWC